MEILIFKMVMIFILFTICKRSFCNENDKHNMVSVALINANNLDAILHALKDYGKDKNPSGEKSTIKQYTCTTVLSEEEIGKISTWLKGNKFPNTFTDQNRRIQVQYNTDKEHGEKIVLRDHLGRLIEQMQQDSREKKHNTYPIVVMYSYNIPCSIKTHECAKLLSEDKKKRINTKTEYTLVIGFSQFFQFRGDKSLNIQNRQQSYQHLVEGIIHVRKMFNMLNNNRFNSLVLGRTHIDGDISFQYIIYSSLIEQQLFFTCITDLGKIDIGQVERILTFSINAMFYACLSASNNYSPKGTFKGSDLQKCLTEWISNNIDKDCDGIGHKRVWKYLLEESIKQGREMATFIGVPNGLDLGKPQWIRKPSLKWQQTPSNFILTKGLLCYKGSLDPASFCTKTITRNQNNLIKRPPSNIGGQNLNKISKMEDLEKNRGLF